MLIVILLYDQLIFRPLVVWGDRFRVDQEQGGRMPRSWALTMMQRSRIMMRGCTALFYAFVRWTSRARAASERRCATAGARRRQQRAGPASGSALLVLLLALAVVAHRASR